MTNGQRVPGDTPAGQAISKLGAKKIAAHLDLTTDAVWKWPKTGDGLIPARYQRSIFELARERGVAMTPAEIMGLPDLAA